MKCGSSPRVWGTYKTNEIQRSRERFIPTSVGNILLDTKYIDNTPVHPHECGEHLNALKSNVIDSGSSPRVWGTLHSVGRSTFIRRFIPTSVGNIESGRFPRFLESVHPHECGEHLKPGIIYAPFLRFIPTSVGNIN